MKTIRQAKLLELLKNNNINTQEELQKKLNESGFAVTQATVSRDIRELGIVKSTGDDGIYKYRAPQPVFDAPDSNDRYATILRQASYTVEAANNLIVLKAHTGMGSAVGAAVDAMAIPGVIGTLAGDDTLLIITHDSSCADSVCGMLRKMIG